LHQDAARRLLESQVPIFADRTAADLEIPARIQALRGSRGGQEDTGSGCYVACMTEKLTPRQIAQLAFLDTLPPKFERLKKIIELLATHHADEPAVRSVQRMTDELKAQASQLNITALAENFGYMGMLLRRPGGQQTKVRGLGELLAGARINFEGACREASTPVTPPDVEGEKISS